jgi:iron complex transport system substrate-binding protein
MGSARYTIALILAVFVCFRPSLLDAAPGQDTATTRIVSLVPNVTELLFAIDAGMQVVGVSDFCRYPSEAAKRPKVGGLINPSLEQVLRLRPGVVLLYRSQQDFAARLTSLGIATEMFQVDTLADLDAAIYRLGAITGETKAADRLASEIRISLQAVRDSASPSNNHVKGLVIVSRDPAGLKNMYQAGISNFIGELFELAGGKIAIEGGAAVSREQIIRADPQLIIDMSGSASDQTEGKDTSTSGLAPVRRVGPWQEINTVPAVKSGHVYSWEDPHAMLLGPSVINTAEILQRLVKSSD